MNFNYEQLLDVFEDFGLIEEDVHEFNRLYKKLIKNYELILDEYKENLNNNFNGLSDEDKIILEESIKGLLTDNFNEFINKI